MLKDFQTLEDNTKIRCAPRQLLSSSVAMLGTFKVYNIHKMKLMIYL